jgi:hypothetical protein
MPLESHSKAKERNSEWIIDETVAGVQVSGAGGCVVSAAPPGGGGERGTVQDLPHRIAGANDCEVRLADTSRSMYGPSGFVPASPLSNAPRSAG